MFERERIAVQIFASSIRRLKDITKNMLRTPYSPVFRDNHPFLKVQKQEIIYANPCSASDRR